MELIWKILLEKSINNALNNYSRYTFIRYHFILTFYDDRDYAIPNNVSEKYLKNY